ncbi:hypothetical protein DFA_04128 [Cavenderia fasciculata]|uniref:Uncharacterized protein n=1 Tax=Cavenderia fasciculata TaxID=261658 RepID=F4Q1D2_CACFS|nr:uncharacterized protein DFA_04128 [Cavenderia fasciculata]EGG18633.1 hypothetical protein DFA_04128 [Cavenderia fasciculata]|eukprot:XP_004366537.1 hypothetical protein DFA_04128 [Cavenderia fasciculata]
MSSTTITTTTTTTKDNQTSDVGCLGGAHVQLSQYIQSIIIDLLVHNNKNTHRSYCNGSIIEFDISRLPLLLPHLKSIYIVGDNLKQQEMQAITQFINLFPKIKVNLDITVDSRVWEGQKWPRNVSFTGPLDPNTVVSISSNGYFDNIYLIEDLTCYLENSDLRYARCEACYLDLNIEDTLEDWDQLCTNLTNNTTLKRLWLNNPHERNVDQKKQKKQKKEKEKEKTKLTSVIKTNQ